MTMAATTVCEHDDAQVVVDKGKGCPLCDAQKTIEGLEKDLEKAKDELAEAEDDLKDSREEVKGLETKVEDLEAYAKELKEKVARWESAYPNG
jgi:archaellum component FlaC